jgi:2-amino-4-hydroxy-6-hydroxymethyldihydropteridine diphosphokinase
MFRAFVPFSLRAKNKLMRIFLSFGSNLGDKQKNIEAAYGKIEKRIGNIVSVSAFYVSEPVGFQSDNIFVNSVCEVNTELDIFTTFAIIQEIEKEIGRSEKSINNIYSDRIIDIDILLADNLIIETPELTIPHPRLHLRKFVLAPLCEIAPDLVHPVLGESVMLINNVLMNNVLMC